MLQRKSTSLRYGVALSVLVVALLIRLSLASFIGQNSFLLFLGAVMVSAWFGGFGPGLLTTTLAVLIADYFFTPPLHSLLVADFAAGFRLSLFALEGGLISLLSAERNRTADELRSARLTQVRPRLPWVML